MRDESYCQTNGHVPHIRTGKCIYCGKKSWRMSTWELVAILFTIVTLLALSVASALGNETEASQYVVALQFYEKATGTPVSEVYQLPRVYPTLGECNDFLLATGPQKGTATEYVVMWCQKVNVL